MRGERFNRLHYRGGCKIINMVYFCKCLESSRVFLGGCMLLSLDLGEGGLQKEIYTRGPWATSLTRKCAEWRRQRRRTKEKFRSQKLALAFGCGELKYLLVNLTTQNQTLDK